jgi:hypothetical protein
MYKYNAGTKENTKMQTISEVANLAVEVTGFTQDEKRTLKNLSFYTGLNNRFARLFVAIKALNTASPSIHCVAVELKKKGQFQCQNFYRAITKLRNENYISISTNEHKERTMTIIDPFVHSILSM